MRKVQVFLREDQKEALKALAARTRTRQSDLIRQSVDLLLQKAEQNEDWRKVTTRAIAGLWRDRSGSDAEEVRRAIEKRFSDVYERR
jgi:hypothetical protein